MKKTIIFGFLLAIPAAWFAIVLIAGRQLPESAFHLLENYLAAQADMKGEVYEIVSITKSATPWGFLAYDNAISYGDSVHFFTDLALGERRQGDKPLTYPPSEAWCVQLISDTRGKKIFLAFHETIYVGDWALHEGNINLAAHLGCG